MKGCLNSFCLVGINRLTLIIVFIKSENDDFTALIVYVDDIMLTRNSVAEIDRIKHILDSNFRIKDLGALNYFLSLEVSHSEKEISLC